MAFMIILLRAKNEDLRENGNKNDRMGLGLVNSAIPVVLHRVTLLSSQSVACIFARAGAQKPFRPIHGPKNGWAVEKIITLLFQFNILCKKSCFFFFTKLLTNYLIQNKWIYQKKPSKSANYSPSIIFTDGLKNISLFNRQSLFNFIWLQSLFDFRS